MQHDERCPVRARSVAFAAFAGLLVLACGDRTLDSGDTASPASSSGETGAATSVTPTTDASPTTTEAPSTTSTTTSTTPSTTDPGLPETTTSTSDDSGSSTGCGFACTPDIPGSRDCNPWLQDCPEGEKCSAAASREDPFWGTNVCVPLARDPKPVGALCEVVGSHTSGGDDCEKGAICMFADENLVGECVPLCAGSVKDPMCPDQSICVDMSDALSFCLPMPCDPLVQDCGPEEACVWTPSSLHLPLCLGIPVGNKGPLEPCESAENECAPGLYCSPPGETSAQCAGDSWCCTPQCDTTEPPECPDPAQTCVSFFGAQAPPGLAHLGRCLLP